MANINNRESWSAWASDWMAYGTEKAHRMYTIAAQPGPNQQHTRAAARATIGLVSVATHLPAAIAGAVAYAVMPTIARSTVGYLDSMITSLWNHMDFNTKIVATGIGSGALYFGIGTAITSPLAAIFAAKIGAEYCSRNIVKEERADVIKEIEEKINS